MPGRTSLVDLPRSFLHPSGGGSAPRLLLGVDGGATKTVAALFDVASATVHLGHGGPSNPDAVGSEAARGALAQAVGDALRGVGAARADATVIAVAGTDTAKIAADVARTFDPACIVVNDVVAAWAAATGARPGVAVIAGTGSNVFGVGPQGIPWRAGGWGYLLGDEGSGFWVAVQALKAALAARDGSGPATDLDEAARSHFGVEPIELLAAEIYARPVDHSQIASFGARVSDVADAGDGVARRVLADGARELAVRTNAVIEQTGLVGEFTVGLVGSNWKAGRWLLDPFSAHVSADSPRAQIARADLEPVGGSVVLAARSAGYSVDSAKLRAALVDALGRSAAD